MKIYDSMQRSVRDLQTIVPNTVSIYSCGPTVYDYLHVGNWSGYIYWDTLVRTLKQDDYHVNWYMNITDVGHLVSDDDDGEDKLEKGAKREGKTAWDIAKFYSKDFIESLDKLNITIPKDHLTPATENIDEQIVLIKILEEKGFTYKISDGIYFDSTKLKDYGKLARLDIEGLQAGARVSIKEKKSPTDFALWKFSPTDSKRDMEWESPWGTGFPGWHIECSAMSMKYLGETIDIHTGGIDHIPIHHTNEIAQSEIATGKTFVNYWLHNNFMMVDATKISKSLNNGITLADLEKKGFSIKAFRLMVLQSHYRTQSNFTFDILESAQNRLINWQAVADQRFQTNSNNREVPDIEVSIETIKSEILDSLNNDLDTPKAIFTIEKGINLLSECDSLDINIFNDFLHFVDKTIGINLLESSDVDQEVKSLIEDRQKARDNKNWDDADAIRDKLNQNGIEIKDLPNSQIWSRAKL